MSEQLLTLPDHDIRALAEAIRAKRLAPPFAAVSLQRLVPTSVSAALASDLQHLVSLGFTVNQVATTLELILKDRAWRAKADISIDLVTTGPEAAGVTNRDTSVVVRELFANARNSVLVAGYAVYQGRRVFQALADRMQQLPGLRVKMFLDVQRPHGDTTAASELVRRFAERFKDLEWPKDRPLPEVFCDPRSLETATDKRTSLHAKCVVVDMLHVFISSANFTEAAHERNIEVGLLIRSDWLAERVVRHFDALLAEGLLIPVF